MSTKRKKNPTLEKQYKQQGSTCYYCKTPVPFEDITRDHIEPKIGGNTLIKNKIFACRTCNMSKGKMTIEEYQIKTLEDIKCILKKVVDANWKITKNQLLKFRRCVKVHRTLLEMIANNNKPKIIFS